MKLSLFSFVIALAFLRSAFGQTETQQRSEFTTLVAHWAEYADPDYLPFLEAARPDIAHGPGDPPAL